MSPYDTDDVECLGTSTKEIVPRYQVPTDELRVRAVPTTAPACIGNTAYSANSREPVKYFCGLPDTWEEVAYLPCFDPQEESPHHIHSLIATADGVRGTACVIADEFPVTDKTPHVHIPEKRPEFHLPPLVAPEPDRVYQKAGYNLRASSKWWAIDWEATESLWQNQRKHPAREFLECRIPKKKKARVQTSGCVLKPGTYEH